MHAPAETDRKRTSLEEVDAEVRQAYPFKKVSGVRDAEYLIAVERAARACRERGWV